MLKVEYTTQFKRDLKLAKKRNKNLSRLQQLIKDIIQQKLLPISCRDHALQGKWNHHRELHIEPDWLLIYKIIKDENIAIFVRTGSHSDLFE